MKSHDFPKDFIKDISLCTIWKCVLKILNFTHSRRRAILDLKRTPSFEKQSTIFFFFLNMHILKTSNGWRSCPLSIRWMDGLLGFGPWGDWKSLGAHALSWREIFFWLFDFFLFLIFFLMKNVSKKFKQTFLWWVHNQNLSNMFLRIQMSKLK